MEFMGTTMRWYSCPAFLAGENVRETWPRVWYVIGKSLPSYRHSMSMPLFCDISLVVTDHRVILSARLFCFWAQDFSIWFAGKSPDPDAEIFKQAHLGEPCKQGPYWKFREAPALPYIEILSETRQKHWYRKPEMSVRLFTRDRVLLERIASAVDQSQLKM